jgi:hypothetical protein
MPRDHRFERYEHVVHDRHEARHHLLRHLHAREGLKAGHRVAEGNADRERQVRDVRERPPRAHRQRGQHREDLLREEPVDRLQLRARALRHLGHPHAVLGERRTHVLLPRTRVPVGQHRVALVDALERLAGREPVGPARVDAGVNLVVETGHAHHEELVEVVGVDREELHALEQRGVLVLDQLQHAFVELKPGHLAVHEQLRRVERRGLSCCGYRFHRVPIS